MKRDIFKLTILIFGAVAITGCTALGHGNGKSRYGDYYAAVPVSQYLRPAPYQTYYFDYGSYYTQANAIETAKSRFQPVPQHVHQANPAPPRPVKLADNISHENGVMVHRPAVSAVRSAPRQSMRHIEIAPEPITVVPEYKTQETYVFEETVKAPAASLQVQPESIPVISSAPAYDRIPEFEYESSSNFSGVDISYVKMGSGSDIADWQACETQVGGYMEYGQTGYAIDPAFDNCMRYKGYKPESEAKEELAGGN